MLREAAMRGGGRLRQGRPETVVHRLHTDTRSIKAGDLFVALRGDRFDGHAYIVDAAKLGAIGAIISEPLTPQQTAALPPSFGLIEVEDTLEALQLFAGAYRRTLPLRTIGVTGSSGKTSTKEMIAAVLKQKYQTRATVGNLNNHVGVPLTLLSLEPSDEFGVIEMGMNHPGEIAPLAAMAAPEIGVITNVGTGHIEFFKDQSGIAFEKTELIASLPSGGVAILDANDPWCVRLKHRTTARIIWVGVEAHADWSAHDIALEPKGIRFNLLHNRKSVTVRLPLYSRVMVTNALLAAAVGGYAGLSLEEIARGLESLKLPGQRMEVISTNGRWLINDAYNANCDSMIAALGALREFPAHGRKVAVLGSMGELGSRAEELHRKVGAEAARLGLDQLLVLGPHAREYREGALAAGASNQSVVFCDDISQAVAALRISFSRSGDCLLVKGSRFMRLENLVSAIVGTQVEAH
ncbi:MAG: UDP-N-acetylmuramoyl-tripeptide--D-alanyl-D-alanine ligase [Candidatus Methylacidiphilales bacterium]|nr:UDP-N-acetylmuramoyl-tripeptide--D-alanyl-D-alanine ligase [Candidatus Methylacidiphilales bacterium]